jgi:putative transposase
MLGQRVALRASRTHPGRVSYPLRHQVPGYTYHVWANGVDGCKPFRQDSDRESFLLMLADEIVRSGWKCLSYTVLSTHYHLLIELEKPSLSSGMQRLASRYTRDYNGTYERRGALWRERFTTRVMESERQLFETHRYIAWNAPKANMCARPEDYVWCSYGAAIGVRPPDRVVDEVALLEPFGKTPEVARRRLREFVEERDPREWSQRPL